MGRPRTNTGPKIESVKLDATKRTQGRPHKPISPIEDQSQDIENEDEGIITVDTTDPRKNPRAERLPPAEFFDFVQQWPTPDDLMIYVYRLEPVIQRKAQGFRGRPVTYINKVAGRITEQWLLQARGSGRYQIRLTDQGTKGKQTRQVCETVLNINQWEKFPPIIDDYSELVDCESNRAYIAGLLAHKEIVKTPDGRILNYDDAQASAQPAGQNDQSATTTKAALDFARDMMTQARQIMPQPNGSKVEEHAGMKAVDTMSAMTLKLMEESKGGGSNDMVVLLMKQNNELMMRFLERQQSPTQTGLKDLAGILEIVDKIRGPGSEAPIWEKVLTAMAPAIPGLLARMGGPAPGLAPQIEPPKPGPVPVHEANMPQPANTTSAVSSSLLPAEQIHQMGVQIISHMERGKPGSDLAAAIDSFYGFAAYSQIAALGPLRMKAALQSDAEIWNTLATFPGLDEFLEDFIAYGTPEEEEPANEQGRSSTAA